MFDIDALSLSKSTFRRRGKKNRCKSKSATCVDGADSSPSAKHVPDEVMTNASSSSSFLVGWAGSMDEPPSPHRRQQQRFSSGARSGTPPSPLRQQRLRFNSDTLPLTPPRQQRLSSGTTLTRPRSLPLPSVTPPASPGGENLASPLRSLLRRPGDHTPRSRQRIISFDFRDEFLSTVEASAIVDGVRPARQKTAR